MEVCANGHGRAFEGRKVVLGMLQVAPVLKPSLRRCTVHGLFCVCWCASAKYTSLASYNTGANPSLRHDLIKIAQIDSYFDRILYSSTEGSDLERDHT